MAQVRHEIYDENGLVKVEFIEVEEQPKDELIAEKESELIRIYEEIQQLKASKNVQ